MLVFLYDDYDNNNTWTMSMVLSLSVIYLGGLQPFFPVTKGVDKILVTMFEF